MKKFDINDDLGLEKRQPDTALNITSIVLGQEVSTIAAEAETEGYGRVYVTYHLSYDANRQGGTVEVRSGVQHINLDIIQFNPLTRTAVIKVYILK
jgi:hypothetical protein